MIDPEARGHGSERNPGHDAEYASAPERPAHTERTTHDEWWRAPLRDTFAGRDVILIGGVPQYWNDHVPHLSAAGAARMIVIATDSPGVGEPPDVPTVVVDPPAGAGIMERLRFANATVADPPIDVLTAVRRFDPDRRALVVGAFLNETPDLDGRPVLAHRRPEWVELEDKTRIDGLWDRAQVARQPSTVVPLASADQAANELDRGDGTVWAADNREGWHGGGALTRWVHDADSRDRAFADLATRSDRVRIMPFIEGVPCSIHGIVFADGVAVLRPVEMVTLRHAGGFLYGGCATYWDPPPEIRWQMRDAARRVAHVLRDEVDFRGTFTIDGVAAIDGFWPTELNPRYGGGIATIARAVGDIPLLLLHDLAVVGRPVGIDAAELERALVTAADARRGGGTWITDRPRAAIDARAVTFEHGRWRWAADGEPGDGSFESGESFARCLFDPDRTPTGPSVAARAAAVWNFASDAIGADLHDVTPAVDPFA